jgi:hypothetical protein
LLEVVVEVVVPFLAAVVLLVVVVMVSPLLLPQAERNATPITAIMEERMAFFIGSKFQIFAGVGKQKSLPSNRAPQ